LHIPWGIPFYDPFPVITPINIPLKALHRLQGIKWDCGVKVYLGKKVIAESCDELLFTAYGISGPASLKVSRWVNETLLNNKTPEIAIDFFPPLSRGELRDDLEILLGDKNKKLGFSLLGILKERVPEVVLSVSGIDPEKRNGTVTEKDMETILAALKSFRIEPGKSRGFDEAVAAAGGVSVDEIDPATMESKLVKGLYITGELLDIDGDSGGFNLQFAWSTGAIAGMSQLSE
jgi:predicted Rossmann fold flavoprotein